MVWYGMVAFLYSEGIQLTAAHSGGRYSDLAQEGTLLRDVIGSSYSVLSGNHLFYQGARMII